MFKTEIFRFYKYLFAKINEYFFIYLIYLLKSCITLVLWAIMGKLIEFKVFNMNSI
jgi:hypothetical protein